MSCENWLPLIEEYLDGELNRKQSANVQAHIASCKTCAAEYDLLKREQEIYSGFDRELELSPDMWSAVRTRIREQGLSPRGSFLSRLREIAFSPSAGWKLSPALAALLVVAAIAVTILVMRSGQRRPEPNVVARTGQPTPTAPNTPENNTQKNVVPPAPSPENTRPSSEENPEPKGGPRNDVNSRGDVHIVRRDEVKPKQLTPQQVVNMAAQQNLLAIKVLTKEISKRKSDLDPMEVARFESALRAVDKTIAETREAVRRHPNDPMAAKYMLDAYSQKVEILKDIAGAQPMATDEVAHPNR